MLGASRPPRRSAPASRRATGWARWPSRRPTTRCRPACTCSRCSSFPRARCPSSCTVARRRLAGPLPDPSPLLGADVAAPALPDDDGRPRAAPWPHVAARRSSTTSARRRSCAGCASGSTTPTAAPYLDAVNNVAVLGHSHPAVAEAAARQLRTPQHQLALPLRPPSPRYAERLAALLPDGLERRVPGLQRQRGQRPRAAHRPRGDRPADVLAHRGAYHGWTVATRRHLHGAASTTRARAERAAGLGAPGGAARHLPRPPPRRGRGHPLRRHVRARLRDLAGAGRGPPPSCASRCSATRAASSCPRLPGPGLRGRPGGRRAAIADEVQVGMGPARRALLGLRARGRRPRRRDDRQGRRATATRSAPCHHARHRGALRTRRVVLLLHGRRAVSCEVGLAVLDALEGERLQENALAVGTHLASAARPGGAARAGRRGARRRPLPGLELVRDRRRSSRLRRRRRPSASGCASGVRRAADRDT